MLNIIDRNRFKRIYLLKTLYIVWKLYVEMLDSQCRGGAKWKG